MKALWLFLPIVPIAAMFTFGFIKVLVALISAAAILFFIFLWFPWAEKKHHREKQEQDTMAN